MSAVIGTGGPFNTLTVCGLLFVVLVRRENMPARPASDWSVVRIYRCFFAREALFGVDSPETNIARAQLAEISGKAGQYRASEALFQRALSYMLHWYKGDHEQVAKVLTGYGKMLQARGMLSKAEPLLYRAMRMQEVLTYSYRNVT
eukprot:5074511-Pyramimonas_sp.AAC.1